LARTTSGSRGSRDRGGSSGRAGRRLGWILIFLTAGPLVAEPPRRPGPARPRPRNQFKCSPAKGTQPPNCAYNPPAVADRQEGGMTKAIRAALAFAVSSALVATGCSAVAGGVHAKHHGTTPRWVKHVRRYPGGISAGVRAYLAPGVRAAQIRYGGAARTARRGAAPAAGPLTNVQANTDSSPPVPQNETAVAYSLDNPLTAVAASNDYVDGGLWIGTTHDGGNHWTSTFLTPRVHATGDFCTGGDPTDTSWTHIHVQPNAPKSKGVGTSANQGVQVAVDDQGGANITFMSEDCNTSIDRGIYFKRLAPDGTLGSLIRVDKPGQWADNPDSSDLLPGKL